MHCVHQALDKARTGRTFLGPTTPQTVLPKKAFSHFPTQRDGLGYGPKKTKRFLHHSPKKTKTKNLIRLDVGVCYSIINGICKVPYVSFLPYQVHLIFHCNLTMLTVYVVQIEPKNGFETEKVKEGYQQCGYLPQAGQAPNVSGRGSKRDLSRFLGNSSPHIGEGGSVVRSFAACAASFTCTAFF